MSETNGTIELSDVENLIAVIENQKDSRDALEQRISELEDRLKSVEDQNRHGRPSRLEAVLDHARNLNKKRVGLNYEQVMAAAHVSQPTAYSYMNELANRDGCKLEKSVGGKTILRIDTESLGGVKNQ